MMDKACVFDISPRLWCCYLEYRAVVYHTERWKRKKESDL